MAKRRRRPHPRPHPATSSDVGTVQTAERTGQAASARRAEKKELARQRREQERKRANRARFVKIYLRLVVFSAILVIGYLWFTRGGDEPARPTAMPGELTTEAPWPPNTEQLSARVDAIGLPAEGSVKHVHANLRIFVHGELVDVPNGIGITQDEIASLHTHDETGTIHVESEVARDFTLGEFFDVWGVRLSGTCLGGYCEEGQDRLRAFVGGEEITGNRRDIVLDDQTVIVMTFGTDEELPDPIPSTFDFASVPQ